MNYLCCSFAQAQPLIANVVNVAIFANETVAQNPLRSREGVHSLEAQHASTITRGHNVVLGGHRVVLVVDRENHIRQFLIAWHNVHLISLVQFAAELSAD